MLRLKPCVINKYKQVFNKSQKVAFQSDTCLWYKKSQKYKIQMKKNLLNLIATCHFPFLFVWISSFKVLKLLVKVLKLLVLVD